MTSDRSDLTLDGVALLLDVDGTLVDSTAAVRRAWVQWSREYDVDVEELLANAHGVRAGDTVRRYVNATDAPVALERLDSLEVNDLEGVVACPGAAALLAAIESAGMQWAVVTSCNLPLVKARMRAAGLPLPDVLVTSESVTNGKPDPEGYRLAAEQLGVSATSCIVIEDAPAGIAAGRDAGATVIAVATTFAVADLEADVVVATLDQVRVGDGVVIVTNAQA